MQTANQASSGAQAEPGRDAQTGDAVNGPQGPAQASSSTAPQAAAQDSATGAATTDGPAAELEAKLAEAETKAREYYDALLRARAETDNTRRRAQEDVSKAHKFGIENFAEAMLPVMDSLQAALSDTTSDASKVREGVELTEKQLRAAFERNKLVVINPTGEKFDPHRHQAISAVPAPEGIAANHVVAVLQPGWMLADRVLRPALVTVAS